MNQSDESKAKVNPNIPRTSRRHSPTAKWRHQRKQCHLPNTILDSRTAQVEIFSPRRLLTVPSSIS